MKSIRIVNNINDIKDSELQNFNEPILIKNGCKDMLAVKKWDIEYFKKNFNNVILPIEKYNSVKNMNKLDKKNLKMKFNNYLDVIDSDKLYYCAEVPLEEYFDKIDGIIYEDIEFDFDLKREPETHLLFLGKNKNSGCHLHIEDDFLLNQIIGEKIVYMFDYNDNPNIKMNEFYNNKSNFIKEDFFSLDFDKLNLYKVELEPGDSLLIPPWWWHATQGIGLSCSVTKTYSRSDNKIFKNYPYLYFLSICLFISEYICEFMCNYEFFIKFILIFLILLIIYFILLSFNITKDRNEIVLYKK